MFGNSKLFKNVKMLFISLQKLCIKIFKFLFSLFGHAETQLDEKDNIFKIYDVAVWKTNNCNTHIGQNLTR